MQHQSRRLHFFQKMSDIDVADLVEKSCSILWRGGNFLHIVKPLPLFGCPVGQIKAAPHLPKGGIVLAPSELDKRQLRVPYLSSLRPGTFLPTLANAPYKMRCETRSGCRAA